MKIAKLGKGLFAENLKVSNFVTKIANVRDNKTLKTIPVTLPALFCDIKLLKL